MSSDLQFCFNLVGLYNLIFLFRGKLYVERLLLLKHSISYCLTARVRRIYLIFKYPTGRSEYIINDKITKHNHQTMQK